MGADGVRRAPFPGGNVLASACRDTPVGLLENDERERGAEGGVGEEGGLCLVKDPGPPEGGGFPSRPSHKIS